MESLKENGDGELTIQNLQPPARRKAPTTTLKPEEEESRKRLAQAEKSYGRGKPVRTGLVKDRKLKANLKSIESKYKDAILFAKDAEILLENQEGFLQPEHELERTYKLRQDEIQQAVGIQQAKKAINLNLDMGPYVADFTRNGRNLLLAGRKGHIGTCEWRAGKQGCEINVNETIRDAKWLHNNQYFAVAQKKHTYIYDHAGVELHCLNQYVEATHLSFLPYHFLLAGVENSGFLRYTDTSTGQIVAQHPTRKGPPTTLAQNPHNAILHVGHQNGSISLWSPNLSTPLVRIQAHAGPVRAAAIDRSGRYMLSAGQDLRLKLWDIRNFKEIHSYNIFQPASTISISDRGLAAIGAGTSVTIWKDLFTSPSNASTNNSSTTTTNSSPTRIQSPYLSYRPPRSSQRIERALFCPYEDVLGLSHSAGFTTLLVPGAGEPNFDALEVNPYESSKQRQETEVKALLTKLQPDTIALNPNFVGQLDVRTATQRARDKDLDNSAADPAKADQHARRIKELEQRDRERNRGRGKNSAVRRYLRKKMKGRAGANIIDEKRLRLEELRAERREKRRGEQGREKEELGPALARFSGGGKGG
jgi:U3 small nucleolar RNA-associated protein 7